MSALIIPCFIKSNWDLKCLNRLLVSVQEQTLPFERVIVVDDNSPSAFELNSELPLELIQLKDNGGPARARNRGIDIALKAGVQNLLFTDHDCILDKNWNKEMSSFLDSTSFAAAGGMTYAWGNTLLDYYHDINGTLAGKWLLPERKELWYMPSLNFGMKAFAAEEFPFDERFPSAAGEDVDLCLRLRSKYKIGFSSRAKLWHDYGYSNSFTGFKKFVKLFQKYKSSSATVYEGHTVLMWDSSESIYKGNMHESNL